jgi:hypothetical protein
LKVPSYAGPLSGLNNSRTHRSGVSVDLSWDPVPWFGIDNYTGVYGLENGVTLIANIPGGRIVGRRLFGDLVTPYGMAGFGFGLFSERATGFLSSGNTYYRWSAAARYGAGTDVQLTQGVGIRIEASRMALHVLDNWSTNWNISTGLVFRLR